MLSAFKRGRSDYGSVAPTLSPYARAAQDWDERIGSSRVQARNWRLMAFGALGLAALSLGGFIYTANQTRIATYVVPVTERGQPGRIVMAGKAYQPATSEIAYFLADWVSLVRSKSIDGVVIRANWQRAYNFITAQAEQTLNSFARDNNPFARVGEEARTIEVVTVLPRSNDTYQVTWRETVYTNGVPGKPETWTGLFTIRISPPQTEQALRANPLGIFITSFQWSREL